MGRGKKIEGGRGTNSAGQRVHIQPMLPEPELSSLQSLEGGSAVWFVYEIRGRRYGIALQLGCLTYLIPIFFKCKMDLVVRIIML